MWRIALLLLLGAVLAQTPSPSPSPSPSATPSATPTPERDVEFCDEHVCFLRANDLTCMRPYHCESTDDCPSDGSSTNVQCTDGECRYMPDVKRSVADTTQCWGKQVLAYDIEEGFTSRCYTGRCGARGATADSVECEWDDETSRDFNCSCVCPGYYECDADVDCARFLELGPDNETVCNEVRCNDAGHCDVLSVSRPAPQGCCVDADDCNDDNVCTRDTCEPLSASCVHAPELAGVGCCATDADCDVIPPDATICPPLVCEVGACLVAPTAPQCNGTAETCQAARFSYCAAETQPLTNNPSVYRCTAGAPATDSLCLMRDVPESGGRCAYGTCTHSVVDGTLCERLAELNDTTFECGCRCGGEPSDEFFECAMPPAPLAYQCVPEGEGGGGTPGPSGFDGFDMLYWVFFGIVALGFLIAIILYALRDKVWPLVPEGAIDVLVPAGETTGGASRHAFTPASMKSGYVPIIDKVRYRGDLSYA